MGRRSLLRDVDCSDIIARAEKARNSGTGRATLTQDEIKAALNPAAYKAYLVTVEDWNEFAYKCLHEDDQNIGLKQVPSLPTIQLHLQWLHRVSVGYLDDHCTNITLDNRWKRLKRAIKLHTDYTFNKKQLGTINHYIHEVMPVTDSLSTKAYPKPVASFEVSKDLIRFLWTCDEYQYTHPRVRLQLLFCILLFSYLGSRPGELIESDAWKDSNEGLLYGDIELRYEDTEEYTGLAIHLKLRNRKGKRKNSANSPVMVLYEEFDARDICPVTLFLGFALADRVFIDCNTSSDVLSRRPPPGSNSYSFRMKPEMISTPFIRSTNPDGTISSSKILTYSCINLLVKGVGQRAGYEERLSTDCFRRGYGNAIDKVSSSGERNRLMGHTSSTTYQAYIPQVVGIDTQSLVRGRPAKAKFMSFNQSMSLRKNVQAPQPKGALLTDVRPFTHEKRDHEDLQIQVPLVSSAEQYNLRRQTRKRMYVKNRQDFFNSRLHSESEEPIKPKLHLSERTPSRYLEALLRYQPIRQNLIKMFYHGERADYGHIVELFIQEANPLRVRNTYPSVSLNPGGKCPDCQKDLPPSKGPTRTNNHLLQCARQRRINEARSKMQYHYETVVHTCRWNDCGFRFRWKSCGAYSLHVTSHLKTNKMHQCLWNGCSHRAACHEDLALHLSVEHQVPNEWTIPTKFHFCFEHASWCMSERLWVHHLTDHLANLNDFCGLIRQQGLVVVAAHCLFCLGNVDLGVQARLHQYHDTFVLHAHMKQHLAELDASPDRCPHPKCNDQLTSEASFWEHANTVHGIPPFGPSKPAACQRIDSEDELMEGIMKM